MIQAYEKLCVEKADLETELGEMVGASGDRCLGTPSPRWDSSPADCFSIPWGLKTRWGCRAGGAVAASPPLRSHRGL